MWQYDAFADNGPDHTRLPPHGDRPIGIWSQPAENPRVAESSGEMFYAAELYRLRGELLLQSADQERAEEPLLLALEVASSNGARLLELRSAVSLAKLRQLQGRGEQGLALLTKVCSWFTEDIEVIDFKEAFTITTATQTARETARSAVD